jgi:hypothetical protein
MSVVSQRIRAQLDESDISIAEPLYREILDDLALLGVDVGFFTLATRARSSCARSLDIGEARRVPALSLFLRLDEQLHATGIDPSTGNWNDEWKQTVPVRAAVNRRLRGRGRNDEWISDATFVMLRSQEAFAMDVLGTQCKDAVRDLVRREVTGADIAHIFWLPGRRFLVSMRTLSDCRRVRRATSKRNSADVFGRGVHDILAAADTESYCRSHAATIEFAHEGMNLFHEFREDPTAFDGSTERAMI